MKNILLVNLVNISKISFLLTCLLGEVDASVGGRGDWEGIPVGSESSSHKD